MSKTFPHFFPFYETNSKCQFNILFRRAVFFSPGAKAQGVVLQVQENRVFDQVRGLGDTSCKGVELAVFALVIGIRLGASPAFWK